MQTYDRLKYIYKGVDMLIKTAKPDCAAVEELFYFKIKDYNYCE
jgi:hypothetical protein